jgi:phenylacetate-CoA ligase
MDALRQKWLDTVIQWRLHPDAPANDRYWAPELDACSRERLKDIQNEKLAVLIPYLLAYSPFYRNKFRQAKLTAQDIRSVDELYKIPPTTKMEMVADVAANPPWGTYLAIDDQIWKERGWMVFATSGTTAAPRVFRHTTHDMHQWAWNDARGLWAMGIRPGRDIAMIAFGYAPHVFLWGVHYAFNLMGVPVIPGGSMDIARRLMFLTTFRPTVLCATPSYAFYLGNKMLEMGQQPQESAITTLVVGGEPGASVPATKQRLESLWGARVFEFYGCTEVAPTPGGYMCEVGATAEPYGPHFMEDQHIVELIDPETFEPVPEGQRGLSVATNLFSEAAPLLRFVIGDFGQFTTAPCACGRTHVRAPGGFKGRADDLLNIRGVTVFPLAIEEVVRGMDTLGDEFAVIISNETGLDELTVQVEAHEALATSERQGVEDELGRRLRAVIEIRPRIEIVPPGTIPRPEFKASRVRDQRREL